MSALMMRDEKAFVEAANELTQFAQETEGVTLAGGRYTRAPENITIPGHLVDHLP